MSERLRVLEKQFADYRSHSIWFYLQAFRCYREKSSSLKKLGTFEVQVLAFAVKYKLMTKELALPGFHRNCEDLQFRFCINCFHTGYGYI